MAETTEDVSLNTRTTSLGQVSIECVPSASAVRGAHHE